MASRKIVSLQKKVREKINSIHEQRNIFIALVDSFVSEADDQADRLLAEHDPGRFMQHYMDVMKILDQAYNSCVMLTAEAEGICETVDMTATEVTEQNLSDAEDETSLKGATAAPPKRSSQVVGKPLSSPVKVSQQLVKPLTFDTHEKSERSPSTSSTMVDQTENFTRSHNKPAPDKCVKNLAIEKENGPQSLPPLSKKHEEPVRNVKFEQPRSLPPETTEKSESDENQFNTTEVSSTVGCSTLKSRNTEALPSTSPRLTLPETKKRVESKHKKTTINTDRPVQPRLDTDVAARFLKNIILQAEKDNKTKKNENQTKEQKPVINTEAKDKSSTVIYDREAFVAEPFETSTKESPNVSNTSKLESVTISLPNKQGPKNDLTVQVPESSMNIRTEVPPLEMNISVDSLSLTANSIGQMSLPVSRVVPVVVSETGSPWSFYIQVINNSLENLMKDIREFMESGEGKQLKSIEKAEEGMVYLAQFSQDQLFYRAKVTEVYRSESFVTAVDVLFIDYGNSEKRNLCHLRSLPLKFTTLPAQAVYCALAKIAPNNKYGVWSEQDILTFSHYVHSKKYFCTLLQPSQHPEIPNIVDLFFNSSIPGNWTPTPVFIQSILMNNNVGKMVTIQEQVTAFLIFFRMSPKSNPSLSPPTSNGSEKSETNNEADTNSRQNILGSPMKRQKSCDTNETEAKKSCDINVGQRKESRDMNENQRLKHQDSNEKQQEKSPEHYDNSTTTDSANTASQRSLGSNGNITSECRTDLSKVGNDCNEASGCDDIESKTQSPKLKASKEEIQKLEADILRNFETEKVETNYNRNKENENGSSKARDKHHDSATQSVSSSKTDLENRSDKSQVKEAVGVRPSSSSPADILSVSNDTAVEIEPVIRTETNMDCDINDNQMTATDVPLPDFDKNATCFNVMISFVKSPSLFFVHIVSEVTAKTLNVMSNNINSHHSQLSRKQLQRLSKSLTPKVGDICCAQFLEDNKFYRAQVIEVQAPSSPQKPVSGSESDSESFGKGRVFFMDYGDTELVPKRKLFPLPKDLQSIPSLAVKCSLAYVQPVGGSMEWSEEAKTCFNKLTGDGEDKVFKMIIVTGSIEKILESVKADPLKVILVDSSNTKEEICLNTDLIKEGFGVLDMGDTGKELVAVSPANEADRLFEWDPMTDDYLSQRNSYKVDVDDAGVATIGYKAQDESRICKYYNLGDCWRGERCPYRHVEMTPGGITLDQDLVYGAIEEYHMDKILPEPGTWVAVEVTTILNPGHFYVSLPFGKSAIDDLKGKEESESKDEWQMNFDQLISEMQEQYNRVSHNEDTTVDKAPGEIIAAKYPKDGRWYRARVLIVEENRLRVFFVDFGNREWLRHNCIRTILPDFLHLPFQAVECFLMSIEPIGPKYSTESKQRFKDLVDAKILVAFVKTRSYNGSMWIDLYDTTGEEDIDIARVLITEKLVQDTGSVASSKTSVNSSQGSLILVPG